MKIAFQGFEEAIAVEKRNGTERRHKLLLDVCATDADGAGVGGWGVGGLGGWGVGWLVPGIMTSVCKKAGNPKKKPWELGI